MPNPITRPWYKKKRYIIPAGILASLWTIGTLSPTPTVIPAAVQTASVAAFEQAQNLPTTTSVSASVTQDASLAQPVIFTHTTTKAAAAPTQVVQTQAVVKEPAAQPAPVVTPQPPTTQVTTTPAPDTSQSGLSNDNYYTNSVGNEVHSPANSIDGSVPSNASAQCKDGSYSFSQHRSGTCSGHGGVATWY